MKKYVISFTLLVVTLLSSSTFAQYKFGIAQGGGRTPVLFSTSSHSDFVLNTGSDPSPPFTVRVWGSVDRIYEDREVIWEESYPTLAPNSQITTSYEQPIPLLQDNRLLAEIVGSDLFFRACVEVSGDTPVCYERAASVFAPSPPSFTASQGVSTLGVELDFTVPTKNGQPPFDYIQLVVEERTLDTVPLFPRVEMVDVVEMELLSDGQDEQTYRILSESIPGTLASFSMRQCFLSGGGGVDDCGLISVAPSRVTGYRRAVANATQGELNDRILVEWPRFTGNRFFNHYYVTRCELGATPSRCTSKVVQRSGDTESYEDTSVVRGINYIYTIDACISRMESDCDVDAEYKNVAESEASFIGLTDLFEPDNRPSEATSINRSVSQLRSFHTSTDEDWVKVELDSDSDISIETSSFNGERTDTVLSLYQLLNGELSLLEENVDANVTAGFSKIETLRLETGTYFVKATHFKLVPDTGGEPVIPAPVVPNYQLTITIDKLESNLIMAPVIDLLLGSD